MKSGSILGALAALAVLAGCAPRRPPFIEPDWGEAPAPYPAEITEVTREYRHCSDKCTFDRITLRRDGIAIRKFLTVNRLDSVLAARIDSVSFVELVSTLSQAGFFRPMIGAGEQVPLSVDSYLISAASLCRRAVATYSPLSPDWYPGSNAVLAIERTTSGLRWVRPDRANKPDVQLSRARS